MPTRLGEDLAGVLQMAEDSMDLLDALIWVGCELCPLDKAIAFGRKIDHRSFMTQIVVRPKYSRSLRTSGTPSFCFQNQRIVVVFGRRMQYAIVDTEEELLSKVQAAADRGHKHCLVQFSAPWCQRCPAFTEAVKKESEKFKFEWVYALLPEAEDLKEAYQITKLPAIVLLHCTEKDESKVAIQMPKQLAVEQAVSPERLEEILSLQCDRVALAFNDDF